MKFSHIALAAAALLSTTAALASPFTTTSPNGGALPSGVTEIGGIVLDLEGSNGVRVVSQLSAASLFSGTLTSSPTTIGTQSGFTAGTIAALGGGLLSASVRITLFDGDSAAGNFDFNDNTLLVNGVSFGNFSTVATQNTSSDGLTVFSSGIGFRDNLLDTGFFTNLNAAALSTLFSSLSGGSVVYAMTDVDPGDNVLDFKQGVAGGLINTGQGPAVAVPEPGTLGIMLGGLMMVGGSMRRRRSAAA